MEREMIGNKMLTVVDNVVTVGFALSDEVSTVT